MKVDKESLVKHHFWILLGTYAPLVLVALMMLWFGVSSNISEKEKALKDTKSKLSSINKPDVKNSHWVEILEKKEGKLGDQKGNIWGQVWTAQSMLTTWPPALVNQFKYLNDLYFLDELTPPQLKEKFINDNSGYYSQLPELVALVDPVNSRGEGAVQFANGWDRVLTFVRKWPMSPLPTSEEIWLAQEDLWVQRELLLVIAEANNYVANFKKTDKPPKPDFSKGEKDRQIFTNPNWKLDVIANQDAVRWQLTNIGKQLQPLAMNVRVWLNGARTPTILWVDGEPLAPRQSSRWQEKPSKSALGKQSIDRVQLVLNWRTAPVKRIDNINLYYNSHRTSHRSLQPPPSKEGEATGTESSGGTGGTGGTGGVDTSGGVSRGDTGSADGGAPSSAENMMKMMGGVGGPSGYGGGMGGQQQQVGLVQRHRYLDVNQQVRRMAIGMVMIVDQAHVQDVLTAFANSKLRFQITQVHWQHFQGSVKPSLNENTTGGAAAVGGPFMQSPLQRDRGDTGSPDGIGGQPPEPSAGGPGPSAPRVPGPGGMGMDTGSTAVNLPDDATNLVELAVYGIASMYQKFPPKDAPPPGSENTTDAATKQ